MADLIYKSVFVAGLLLQIVIRAPFDRQRRQNKIVTTQASSQERVLLGLLTLGGFVLPVIYIFTPWLNFANYDLPVWAPWIGVALMIGALVVFWRGHYYYNVTSANLPGKTPAWCE